ncbi:VOC family protein [Rubrobacter calidifluminis]|uniref:VOC family protein n=1 Tax=Rubrobacter calidifluminis TaxID=1392640 RepID=UPI0023608C65|nr:VOC family protein [Rubrobacter calidifluminis]
MSVGACDLDASSRFYRELFGMEEIPSPNFPLPVRWLRLGDLQLHLFQTDDPPPRAYHFGIDVDDFEKVYERSRELGVRVEEGYYSKVYELPDGAVQLYLRDPAGNLVEVNHPDSSSLDHSVVSDLQPLPAPQTRSTASARLYQARSGRPDGPSLKG